MNILRKDEKKKIFFFYVIDLELRYREMMSCLQSVRKICNKMCTSPVPDKCPNKKYLPLPIWLKRDWLLVEPNHTTAPVHLKEGKRNWTRLQSCQPEECWPQTAFSPTIYQRKGKEVLKIGLILFRGENVGNDYCKNWLAVVLRDQILEKNNSLLPNDKWICGLHWWHTWLFLDLEEVTEEDEQSCKWQGKCIKGIA